MTNKKCLLDTIASYSLDVTLAVGTAAACAAMAPILRLSEPLDHRDDFRCALNAG
jgi:hypothetical protein